jgi:hypothetical protein
MKYAEGVALAIVTFCVSFFFFEGGMLLRHTDKDLASIKDDVHATMQNSDTVLKQTTAVLARVNGTVYEFSKAAEDQSAYYKKTQLQVYKLITDAKEIMVRTDRSLNDVLVPKLAKSVDASVDLERAAVGDLQSTTERVNATIDALQPAISGINLTSEAAATAFSDPAIHSTLVHVDAAAGNVEGSSADIRAYIHRMTAPARGVYNFFKEVLSLTFNARGALGL